MLVHKAATATAMLIAEPVAAALAAVFTYIAIAKVLPGMLVNLFPPDVDGVSSGVTVESLARPLHWIALIGATALAVQAFFLGRRANRTYHAWVAGLTPACPECGNVMKQGRSRWRCYRFPFCSGSEKVELK